MTDESDTNSGEVTDQDSDADGLTPTDEQKAALETDHHISITAGAGTGKTFTLTERYLHILEETDATPQNIVTITFTTDAANELQDRIRDIAGERLTEAAGDDTDYDRWRAIKDDIEDGYIHTIHGFCARLLREFVVDAPVEPDFDVYDEADATALSQRISRRTVGDLLHLLDTPDAATPDAVTDSSVSRGDATDAVHRLTRLWNRSTLEDILVGLLDARPASKAWADNWADATPDEYETYVWNTVHPITESLATELLADDDVQNALNTIRSLKIDGVLADIDPDDDDGADTIAEVCRLLDRYEPLESGTDTKRKQQFLDEFCDYLTKNGGTRYSQDWRYRGAKGRWKSAGRADDQSVLMTAIDDLFTALNPADLTFGMDPEMERISGAYVIALARVFRVTLTAYNRAKARQNALDYEDLIRQTTTLLRTSPRVYEQLAEQFSYIMVDEMQDTDRRQWRLIKLLAGLSDEQPVAVTPNNVFLVGDEKQSIYRFRGADVTTFGEARRDLLNDTPDAADTDLELSGSFRTAEETLTFCNELFERLFEPLDDTYADYEARPQTLHTERTEGTDVTGTCELFLIPDDDYAPLHGEGYIADTPQFTATGEREAYALAARLTQLLDSPPQIYDDTTDQYRAAQPQDITIMLRTRSRLKAYERSLDEYDIPYTVVSGTGFYDAPEITTVLNLLRVLEDPHDELALYGVLRSPLFGFTDQVLAQLRLIDDDLWTALETVHRGDISLPHETSTSDASQVLATAYETITRWRRLAGTHPEVDADAATPWATVLTHIIEDTGLIASFAGDERPRQAAANINRLREQLRRWEEAGLKTLSELLTRLERVRDLSGHTAEATIPEETDGVQIRTIHSAKGLEFPIVVVPELGTEFNFRADVDGNGKVYFEELAYPGTTERVPGLGIQSPTPEDAFDTEATLTRTITKRLADQRERAELKRLLYVAATRTRDHLLLSGVHEIDTDNDEFAFAEVNDADNARCWRDWTQPILCDDALLSDLATEKKADRVIGDARYRITVPQAPIPDWQHDHTVETPSLDIDIPAPPPVTRPRVTTATEYAKEQSPGAHDTYFEEDDTPGKDTDTTATPGLPRDTFGTIVHRLCELRPPEHKWKTYARSVARRNGEQLTDADYAKLREHTQRAIAFVDDYEADLDITSRHDELGVVATFDNARLIGEIDHLAITDCAYHIIDYKTNDLSDQRLKDLQQSYRPQLQAYAVALHQNDPSKSVRASLYFTDGECAYTVTFEPPELEELADQIMRELYGISD